MAISSDPVFSTHAEKWENSPCPYCGSLMREGECPSCGHICPSCGTPSKEPSCPECGHGSFPSGYSPTGSPAPAQSPELGDVQRILGRTPSRREYNMVRGIIDRDKERVHRLTELLCQKFPAPMGRELIEFRALQVRKVASKDGADLTHAECVIFAFLESARHTGMLEAALRALAEAQLLDSNLRLGLSNVRLPSVKLVVEVSGSCESVPLLLVDGERRKCKIALLEKAEHRRLYVLYWSPLLSECLGPGFGSVRKIVSATIESEAGTFPLRIALKESAGDWNERLELDLDPRRLFYNFSKRKEIEVDIGIPVAEETPSDAALTLRAIGRKLDRLEITKMLFREANGGTPSSLIWMSAHSIIKAPSNSQIAVSPRKKASAALIAADMEHFSGLDVSTRTKLVYTARRIPLNPNDQSYVASRGLLVPTEFSTISGVAWSDALDLAVKFLDGIREG